MNWIHSLKNHLCLPLAAGFLLGALLPVIPVSAEEISPDDFAKEYGLPLEDDQPFTDHFGFAQTIPQTRTVAPANFKKFRVNVDIFRKSTTHPILGPFREEYTETLVPNGIGMSREQREIEARKRFDMLADLEFAVVTLDGVPLKAYVVSGAVERMVNMVVKNADKTPVIDPATNLPMTRLSMKSTPPGNYRLDPIAFNKKFRNADGVPIIRPVAYPWLRSEAYNNSQMFWGLWIKGGFFIHSTPHYGELGRPASMGCIRQSFPDAQELFKLVVEDGLSAMIRIHEIDAENSVSRLREIIVDLAYTAPEDAPVNESPKDPSKDMNWVLAQLQRNYRNIKDSIEYFGTDVEIVGHAWMDRKTRMPSTPTWPNCGSVSGVPIDCFKIWNIEKPSDSMN